MYVSFTDTVKFSSRLDENRSSFTASQVEKCSFQKNACKNLKSACRLSEAFDVEGRNLKKIRCQTFCSLFLNP